MNLHEMKNKKNTRVFLYINNSKFWSVSLEHFVERKPLIYEEWLVSKNGFWHGIMISEEVWGSLNFGGLYFFSLFGIGDGHPIPIINGPIKKLIVSVSIAESLAPPSGFICDADLKSRPDYHCYHKFRMKEKLYHNEDLAITLPAKKDVNRFIIKKYEGKYSCMYFFLFLSFNTIAL